MTERHKRKKVNKYCKLIFDFISDYIVIVAFKGKNYGAIKE